MKNKYEIRGDETVIFLQSKDGRRIETIIETEDLSKVSVIKGTWFCDNRGYVVNSMRIDGKTKHLVFHRLLLGANKGFEVDHINHDKLDNRRCNLRETTISENQQNRSGANKNSKSGIRGVTFHVKSGKWNAKIKVNRKAINLGYFVEKEDAKKAVETARKDMMTHSVENNIGAAS